MKKRVLVLNANPKQRSLCGLLAEAYAQEARAEAEVRTFQLAAMDFNPDLQHGYDRVQPLEPSLAAFQEALVWAEHLLICTPIWWVGIPAKFKGLLDRTLLPGFAFNFEAGNPHPIPLLGGKSVRILMTMDAPPEYYVDELGAPALKQLDLGTFKFCGFERVECDMFGPVIDSDEAQRQEWLERVKGLGADVV
ncbi:NAD(P)H-dependent oxidoreductase [Marinobacterium arenosum]|uniref:NAD(P)H-dependent oxidoreductase n=1 Tax=Marinobacterium arenosum TaxID=2862496 RepID=UPI001C980AB6|nr:NAD(P)H-dependent oxidoreductase [Marinobacterium arenosum]MBY4678386.1 NAD(P)H-dependent oxidoreductase [Marinobacterium arenosum]